MPKEIHVEGYKQFKETLQNVDVDKNDTFVLFSGTKDEKGKSWCPDCVTAEPVIEECLKLLPDDTVFLYCGVGDRNYWKDKSNDFRKDTSLMLKAVPTLLKLGQNQKLQEEQCADKDLVMMMFSE